MPLQLLALAIFELLAKGEEFYRFGKSAKRCIEGPTDVKKKASIAIRLPRAKMPAAFFVACLAALALEGVRLDDL